MAAYQRSSTTRSQVRPQDKWSYLATAQLVASSSRRRTDPEKFRSFESMWMGIRRFNATSFREGCASGGEAAAESDLNCLPSSVMGCMQAGIPIASTFGELPEPAPVLFRPTMVGPRSCASDVIGDGGKSVAYDRRESTEDEISIVCRPAGRLWHATASTLYYMHQRSRTRTGGLGSADLIRS